MVPGTGTPLVGREDIMDPVVTSEVVPGISVVPVVAGTAATLVELGRDEETDSVAVAVAVTVEDPVLVTKLLPVDTVVLGTGVWGVPGTEDCEVTKVVPGVGVWDVPTSVVPGTEL